ncbi:MAG TPA: antibiotic biosynthesis monooxygenase [Thermomicrobiaceae bacterium]|nr:antibiotic biosynthesis monooxygenase [Thermomicrobiaceae bacterium]
MHAHINQFTLKSGSELPRESTDRWRATIERQPGFVGFLSLREQDEANHVMIVTLWESVEAAHQWGQNPDFVHMRDTEIEPAISDWKITHATVEAADLNKISV